MSGAWGAWGAGGAPDAGDASGAWGVSGAYGADRGSLKAKLPETLRAWARQLGLKQGSEGWLRFFDLAAVDAGRIPDYLLKDQELVSQLPVFFRTLSGQ